MPQVSTNAFKTGMKIEINREPYTIVGVEFVKPGKGQAFTRTKLKQLPSGRVVEKTFKSGEKIDLADIEETEMRLLYKEGGDAVFMDDQTYEQVTVPLSVVDNKKGYMIEDTVYELIFYNGNVIDVTLPTFLNMTVTETAPGARGDTASGRVLKPAITDTGAAIQIPIFIGEGERVKIDTRTGEYVSRVKE
ncbi:MAG: elongation factor P [Chlamydiota bacterium]